MNGKFTHSTISTLTIMKTYIHINNNKNRLTVADEVGVHLLPAVGRVHDGHGRLPAPSRLPGDAAEGDGRAHDVRGVAEGHGHVPEGDLRESVLRDEGGRVDAILFEQVQEGGGKDVAH